MPKIERSVAYTFDAYSGGMKVDFLGNAIDFIHKSMDAYVNHTLSLQNKRLDVGERVLRIRIQFLVPL